MFFSLSSLTLTLLLVAIVGGVIAAGVLLGRYLRKHSDTLREPFGVLQGALLGVVGLILAFGLSLAVGRYEDRRAAVVAEANAIGTTYLRAQLLAEPERSRSLALLREYTDLAIRLSHDVPNSSDMKRTAAAEGVVQRRLWALAGEALDKRARRERPSALRRHPQLDDRHADSSRLGSRTTACRARCWGSR